MTLTTSRNVFVLFICYNHELPRTPNAGLHIWLEVVGDDGDFDGQLMAVDDWYWR